MKSFFKRIVISFVGLILIQGCSMVKPLFEPIKEEDRPGYAGTSILAIGFATNEGIEKGKTDNAIVWGLLGLYYGIQYFNYYDDHEKERVKTLPTPTNQNTITNKRTDDSFSGSSPISPSVQPTTIKSRHTPTPPFLPIQPIGNRHKTQQPNTKLHLKITNTPSVILDDYIDDFTLEIDHPINVKIDKSIIYLDDTQILPTLINEETNNPRQTIRHYKLGIPKGINNIEAYVTTNVGASNTDYKTVESESKAKPTLHVVVIGVNEFPQWNEKGVTLVNSINDRQLVIDTFEKKSSYLFGNDNVKFYPKQISSTTSTKQAIKNTVQSIRNNIKPNDYFLFYVSTHGDIVNSKYHFSPSNYSYDEKNFIVKNEFGEDDLSDYLINIPTIFRLVILDTCHSGKQVSAFTEQLKQIQLGNKEGVSILTASKDKESANANYKGYGLFTYVLAKGLSGEADTYPKKDFMVDSIEIAKYLEKNVYPLSKTAGMAYEHTAVTYSNKRFDLTLLRRDKKPSELKPDIYTESEKRQYLYQIDKGLKKQRVEVYNTQSTSTERIEKKLKEQGTINLSINFDTGSANIKSTEYVTINKLAEVLKNKNFKDRRVFIEGHTDNVGEQDNNLRLSQARANSIAEVLIAQGINIERLEVIGYGETYPIQSNDTEEGRYLNRRVSISIE